jgi:isopenicillin-N epimerase
MMKDLFLLDPEVIYLNHGSFGACPAPVFAEYQRWQRELEREPVEFLGRRAPGLLAEARRSLAGYLGCEPNDVVYFPNPTTAINMVVRSLGLGPDDEILASDHEYGAMDRTWRFMCSKTGARYVRQPVAVPAASPEQVLEELWGGVGEHTRVIFISHITSPTALCFPVEAICARARQAGILTIIDGAHAPGQIDLDLTELGADLYTGACHKWMCAPKGAAFLYARPEVQGRLEPLVVSWGWEPDEPGPSPFIDRQEWQGTRDLSAFLSVPAAIEFQREHDWAAVRRRCRALAREVQSRLRGELGLQTIAGDERLLPPQLFSVGLPQCDPEELQRKLLERFRIEVVARRWKDLNLLRVSIQAYNDGREVEALVSALRQVHTELHAS